MRVRDFVLLAMTVKQRHTLGAFTFSSICQVSHTIPCELPMHQDLPRGQTWYELLVLSGIPLVTSFCASHNSSVSLSPLVLAFWDPLCGNLDKKFLA